MSKAKSDYLQATVDRFENGFAILDFGKIGQLTMPKKYLPSDVGEGSVLTIELMSDKMATERKRNLAKAILKEILNS